MNLKCPHCSKVISVSETLAGKKASCPYCKQIFLVPGKTSPKPIAGADGNAPSSSESKRKRRSRSSRRKKRHRSRQPEPIMMSSPAPPASSETASPSASAAPADFAQPQSIAANRKAAFWKRPAPYGFLSVLLAISAFPATTILSSERIGIIIAAGAGGLGLLGSSFALLFHSGRPTVSLVGLATSMALLFGLMSDMDRREMAKRADEAAGKLESAKKKEAAAKKMLAEAKAAETNALDGPKKILKKAKKLKEEADAKSKKSKEELQEAEKEKLEAMKLLDAAKKKESELDFMLDQVKKETDALDELKKEVAKAKKELENAKSAFKTEKDKVEAKLKEAHDILEKAEDLKKSADAAIKLIMTKLQSSNTDDRLNAAKALALIGTEAPESAAYGICEATMAADEKLRDTALFALQKVRPSLYVPVVTLVKSTEFGQAGINPNVYSAAKKLQNLKTDAASSAPILTGHLQKFVKLDPPNDADLATAKTFAEALGLIVNDDAKAIEVLGTLSSFEKPSADFPATEELRHAALASLYEIGKTNPAQRTQIVPLLAKGLKEKKAVTRKEICEWLGEYGADAKGAVAAIKKLQSDGDANVKTAAEAALKKIGK